MPVRLVKVVVSTWRRGGRGTGSQQSGVWRVRPLSGAVAGSSFWALWDALCHVLTTPRLQEPRQPHSRNLSQFMLKDKWLIIKVVFFRTKLNWEKMFSFYYSDIAK